MTAARALLLLLWALPSSTQALFPHRELQTSAVNPVCGDCYCVPEDGSSCPSDTTGIWSSFPESYPTLFTTFVPTSTTIDLVASDGSSAGCYPFADVVGPIDNFDESSLPQCELTTGSDSSSTAVCAYKFAEAASDTSDCPDREYELVTYKTATAASLDGALMIHSGQCGVCSSAQDLAVRMSTLETFQSASVTCATAFAFGGTFADLVACYETVGFATPCATAWAYYIATSAKNCASACAGAGTSTPLFGDAPTCEWGDCLKCSEGFGAVFDSLTGIGLNAGKAGFNVGNPYPCSTFSQIAYDPCFSGTVTETTSPAPASPETPAPAPTPDNTAPTVAEVPTAGGGGDGGGDSASWRLAGSSAIALVVMVVSFVV